MSALRVVAAGPLSTLQDAGRFGYRRYGVSVAGAFDPLLLAAANALVGNSAAAAGIEFTLLGDSYVVEAESMRVALAGDFAAIIDGEPAAPWRSHRLNRGQTLVIGAARSGARGYLAVAGAFAIPPVLGSRSTHVRTGVGGLAGRALAAGDVLPLAHDSAAQTPEQRLDPADLPPRGREIRVVLGPQDDHFDAAARAIFLDSDFAVTAEADRMGMRLAGPRIAHAKGFNIVSDGIPTGAIQVPGTGQPIILLVDCQTAGGYPKIAVVIAPDIAALAQVKPGATLRFRAIDEGAARAAHLEFRQRIADLPQLLRPVSPDLDSATLLALNLVDGVVDMASADWRDGEGP